VLKSSSINIITNDQAGSFLTWIFGKAKQCS